MTPRQAYDTHRRVERATEKAGTLDMKIKWAGYETSCVLETKDGYQHSCFTMEELEAFLDGLTFHKHLLQQREAQSEAWSDE